MKHAFSLFILSLFSLLAQAQDTLKLVNWNVLNVSTSSLAARTPQFRTVFSYLNPDLICLQEIANDAVTAPFLANVLNVNGQTDYVATPFVFAGGSQNYLFFYKQSKLGFLRSFTASGTPRITVGSLFYHKSPELANGADTVYLLLYTAHFKATDSQSDANQRATQALGLVSAMDTLPPYARRNVILAGDFNVYRSSEPMYQTLVTNASAPFRDPINRIGSWHNSSAFADVHTQSPRTAVINGGANGGMDDRFDQIIVTPNMLTGGDSIRYIAGTYRAVGNDGRHFNLAITDPPTNTSAPQAVIQAIHDGADHIPVEAWFAINQPRGPLSARGNRPAQLQVQYGPTQVSIVGLPQAAAYTLHSSAGQQVGTGSLQASHSSLPTQGLAPGLYLLRASTSTGYYMARVLVR